MIRINDIYWTAGFLEGEGCFTLIDKGPIIEAAQVNKDPLEKLQNLFRGSLNLYKNHKNPNSKPIWTWSLRSSRSMGLMMTLYSIISAKRQDQILKVIKDWKSRPSANKYKKHCPYGHPYSPRYNKRGKAVWRECRECRRAQDRARWPRRKKGASLSKNQLTLF